MELYFRIRKAGYRIAVIHKTLANFQMGGVSSKIPITEVTQRINRRYEIYRENGYSAFYKMICHYYDIDSSPMEVYDGNDFFVKKIVLLKYSWFIMLC